MLQSARGFLAKNALGCAVGAAVFFWFFGLEVLDPANVNWLKVGDRAQHQLGWMFFAQSPWSWPPAMNPRYGMELGAGICMTDSLPLFALPAKVFASSMEAPVQYFGAWILLCCLLQAWLGSLLARRAADTWAMTFAGAVLFGTTPFFLLRASGHAALSGNWIILLALLLCGRRGVAVWWVLLLSLTILVHSYLFVMVALMWMADLGWRFFHGRVTPRGAAGELLGAAAGVLLAAWLAGYLMLRDGLSGGGYGSFAMELPSSFLPGGYSRFFRWINVPVPYEGFLWCGAGGMILLMGGLVALYRKRNRACAFAPYVVCSVLLLLFAATHRLHLGGAVLELPLPEVLVQAGGVLRASGRMAWPVAYAVVWAGFWFFSRWRHGGLLVCAFAAIQIADISPLRERIRRGLSSSGEDAGFVWTPRLEELRGHYDSIRRVPSRVTVPDLGVCAPEWEKVGWMAATTGMATDVAYLSRYSQRALEELDALTSSVVFHQNWNPRTLYLLDPRLAAWLADGNLGRGDGLLHFGEMKFLAPGGADFAGTDHPGFAQTVVLSEMEPLEFRSGGGGEGALLSGWSGPEEIGRWMDRDIAMLIFAVAAPGGAHPRLSCLLRGMVCPEWPKQRVEIWVNGTCAARETLQHGEEERWVDVPLPEGFGREGGASQLLLGFFAPDARAPAEFMPGDDTRRLGMLLRRIELRAD